MGISSDMERAKEAGRIEGFGFDNVPHIIIEKFVNDAALAVTAATVAAGAAGDEDADLDSEFLRVPPRCIATHLEIIYLAPSAVAWNYNARFVDAKDGTTLKKTIVAQGNNSSGTAAATFMAMQHQLWLDPKENTDGLLLKVNLTPKTTGITYGKGDLALVKLGYINI